MKVSISIILVLATLLNVAFSVALPGNGSLRAVKRSPPQLQVEVEEQASVPVVASSEQVIQEGIHAIQLHEDEELELVLGEPADKDEKEEKVEQVAKSNSLQSEPEQLQEVPEEKVEHEAESKSLQSETEQVEEVDEENSLQSESEQKVEEDTKEKQETVLHTRFPNDPFLNPECNLFYVAEPEDTAWNITINHGFTWSEFVDLNPLPRNGDYRVIFPGDVFCIGRDFSIPASNPDRTYKTIVIENVPQPCTQICFENKLAYQHLLLLNPDLSCRDPVPVGTKVVVSRGLPPNCTKIVPVYMRDTGSSIAIDNNITLDQLKKLNPGIDVNTIYIWTKLCVNISE